MTEQLLELFEAEGAQRIPRNDGKRDENDLWGAAFESIGEAVKAVVAVCVGAGAETERQMMKGTAGQHRGAIEILDELEAIEVHGVGTSIVIA